jgi:hypothetical protein
MTRLARWFSMDRPVDFTAWILLRLLGLVYLAAFLSIYVQVDGLIGSDGIQPAGDYLLAVQRQLGENRFHAVPTIFWWSASDAALHLGCQAGIALSILALLGVVPVFSFLGLWVLYTSVLQVGAVFLMFQWDILLVEAGFLAIFLSPFVVWSRPGRDPAPSRVAVWLFRWLLFRLMLASGIVKLTSQDPTWWSLTALRFHYETQPLPTMLGYLAHQLPDGIGRFSCGVMFVIELVLPFGVFGPRPVRLLSCAGLIVLQVLILLTGNYCFFNYLTLVLCLALLDDDVWPSRLRREAGQRSGYLWPRVVLFPLALLLFEMGLANLGPALHTSVPLPGPVADLNRWLEPYNLSNHYGLFARMTTTRPEIEVEGSADGQSWVPYTFRYKPGRLTRAPSLVAPHQPRLDWQMWFAALGDFQSSPWFANFCLRLLQGAPSVVALLESNPFPKAPPRFVRAVLYQYHFTDWSTFRKTGEWWTRERQGLFAQPMALRRELDPDLRL